MTERSMERRDSTSVLQPQKAAREGELSVARAMRAAGHVHQALHVLSHLLQRYPQDAESRVVADEIAALARDCQQRGQYYTALQLYRQLEQLA